ncbi:hypothetical protein J1N35_001685 [Gossypium stocksii]|uniref:Reverse transcriptase domain-containing protein n=1 Tax=Gossypium stocksii TaxID=47602 RepID=A0A9D4ALJ8_9ROSI|nr:hypothetical protein J1N35_001685 [Gossypium stocksii]
MEEITRSYFQNLFAAGRRGDYEHLLSGINCCISEEDNTRLIAGYTKEEIQEALSELGPTKAPGEDGLPALFYQKCWPIIGEEVASFCLGVLNGGMDISVINKTNIVLIPKIPNPISITHFRPISLCNVLYKLIAKVLANRLRSVIDKCIDPAQSAFVPERLISDNVLLAYEILHSLKQKKTGNKGFMAVKLDTRGHFRPTRGLKQGDPLSPFLFLICGEGLSSLIRLAMNGNILRGVKASRSGSQVSHFLFADDCILFGEATERGAQTLKRILLEYENCSGQCVNYDKSTVFFSTNTQEEDTRTVFRILGVRSSNNLERNQLVYERKNSTGREISNHGISYISELNGVEQKKLTLTIDKSYEQTVRNSRATVFFDAAFNKSSFKSASGLAVRDER